MTLTELDQIVRKQEEIAELHEQLRDINAVRIYLRERESLYSKLASLTKERNEQGVMKMENAQTENSAAGGASALTAGLGGEELAWQQQARQQNAFEFFAAVIFGMDITRLGAVYLEGTTLSAWEAWQEAEENETMPALGPERETLKELARLSIENMRLKQTMPNADVTGLAPRKD